ncbi:hypothetical protein [Breoghania sp.]|uniref:hypothetical protein n=1 Tax=Breoghania sp. TaxID=2065378 RepID=UPI0026158E60|nr:hypothetical protein [Breoghania sp.]MDJ0930608.1 hypothetical protein [Breoghania sp.]
MDEAPFDRLFSHPNRPYIAYFHLSPHEPFEQPDPFIERALADSVFANSEETRRELALHGINDVALFQNPALACFDIPAQSRDELQFALSISNHVPAELCKAFEILKTKGVDMLRIGSPEANRRVTPEDIAQCDAIVTIGKSVQYGFRSRQPVFCYNHFGGPGWLIPWASEDKERNFSGRSSPECRSPDELAELLLSGFSQTGQWARTNNVASLEQFHLEHFVDELLARATQERGKTPWPDWTRENGWRKDFRTERSLYRLIDREFARGRKLPCFNTIPTVAKAVSGHQLEKEIIRVPKDGEPMVIAGFSFRYDVHLVPDLIENIRPAIHGYVALDDRAGRELLTNEADRQSSLYAAAAAMGAKWIFAVVPDERFEDRFGNRISDLTTQHGPVVWTFNCRKMFDKDRYRVDGIWKSRNRARLFPCFPGMEPDGDRLHGRWTKNAPGLPVRPSGLEFFHLRMALPKRRKLRMALYCNSDPTRNFQTIGYDYLDDERGMKLRAIPAHRRFSPPFTEDGGTWGAQTQDLSDTPDGGQDPLLHKLRRVVKTRQMLGFENAMHVGLDLMNEHPHDREIALMAADSALMEGFPETTLRIMDMPATCQPFQPASARAQAVG